MATASTAPSIIPPRTPTGRIAVDHPEAPLDEQDLAEAFAIACGTTLMLPERRHLVALAKAWDEAIDLSSALLGYFPSRKDTLAS